MTDLPPPRLSPWKWLTQQLRIDAIRTMFAMVDVTKAELYGLMALATLYALLDGIGLSVLLPVLQYTERGAGAVASATGDIWTWPTKLALALGVPVNLVTLLIMAFIPVVLRQVAVYLNAWYSALVSNRIVVRMCVRTIEAMMGADADFFSAHPQGELTGVALGQTSVAGVAVLQVMKLLSVVLQIVIYTLLLSYLSLPLTLLAILAGLAVSSVVRSNMKRTSAFGRTVAEVTQKSFGAIVERIALVRLVKMRAQEQPEVRRIQGYTEDVAGANTMIARLGAKTEVTADPLLMLSAFATLYLGITVLDLRLAELGMLLYVLTRLNGKVKEFNATRQTISASMAGLNMVRELTDTARAANTIESGPLPFTELQDKIEYRNVQFTHAGADAPTLNDLSATISAGSFTAIVGRSGSGKSTFVELIPRLRDIDSGAVTLDGIDVREFDLGSLRRSIGYLTQDALLFNDTVRGNLTYGLDRDVSEEQIVRALKQAHATFVLEQPDGLETRLGDRGARFSGGEKQRLAMARVLLDDPAILILDEPTSALDSESERYIQDALTALHGTKTIIVIAHRLATVMAADQLLVMDEGRIVQRGTHAELVSIDGPYQHLFESQLLKE